MPAAFDKCVREGGKVVTKELKDGKYMHICYDKAGNSYPGEVKEKKASEHFKGSVTDLLTLSPTDGRMSEIEVLRVGKWDHPIYGQFEITPERLQRFKQNFDDKVRKVEPAIDVEHHSDEGAVGWVKELIFKGDVLTALIEWTDEGMSYLQGKKYRYFSPEFADEWSDPASGAVYMDVLIGGAITNRPFFQELEEIVLSDKSLITKKGAQGGDNTMEKCTVCDKMIPKNDMTAHMKDMHPGNQNMKHNEKGGENTMTREELKKKLLENPDFTLAEAGVDSKLFDEVKEEVDQEAEEKKKKEEAEAEAKKTADEEAAKKEAEAKQASDRKITVDAKKFSDLEAQAKMGVEAHKELQSMKMSESLAKYTFSETNKEGVILPKDVEEVKKFALTLGQNQRDMFFNILSKLPKVKLFGEVGGNGKTEPEVEGDAYAQLDARAKKLMSEQPTVYKTYSDAAKEAERLLTAEGVDFTKVGRE